MSRSGRCAAQRYKTQKLLVLDLSKSQPRDLFCMPSPFYLSLYFLSDYSEYKATSAAIIHFKFGCVLHSPDGVKSYVLCDYRNRGIAQDSYFLTCVSFTGICFWLCDFVDRIQNKKCLEPVTGKIWKNKQLL